jgi:hypothetical protein
VEGTTYRYELRRGEEIVATGHLTQETPLQVGDRITLGRTEGVVREVGSLLSGERRLIVQLPPGDDPVSRPSRPA